MTTENQRVYAAVRDGNPTSRDCARATGISATACSAYLSLLHRTGMLRATGRQKGTRGHPYTTYAVKCPHCLPGDPCIPCLTAPYLNPRTPRPGRILDPATTARLFK